MSARTTLALAATLLSSLAPLALPHAALAARSTPSGSVPACASDAARQTRPAVSAQVASYPTSDGAAQLALHVFRPSGSRRLPVVMVVHGGGWAFNSACNADEEAANLAATGKLIGVSIDYRLACATSSNPLCGPWRGLQLVDDARAAMRYLRANAASFGGDGRRVGALGLSAGGHLVYMLATTGAAGEDRPDAVVGLSGPADLPYACTLAPASVGCQQREGFVGRALAADRASWAALSPLSHVSAASAAALIVGAKSESIVPFAEAQELYDAYRAAGASATLCMVKGGGHAGKNEPRPCMGTSVTVWNTAAGFLESQLGG